MTKRDGANRVADGFNATGGPTAAAEAVQELLDSRRTIASEPAASDSPSSP
jgi:hypothetical protein